MADCGNDICPLQTYLTIFTDPHTKNNRQLVWLSYSKGNTTYFFRDDKERVMKEYQIRIPPTGVINMKYLKKQIARILDDDDPDKTAEFDILEVK